MKSLAWLLGCVVLLCSSGACGSSAVCPDGFQYSEETGTCECAAAFEVPETAQDCPSAGLDAGVTRDAGRDAATLHDGEPGDPRAPRDGSTDGGEADASLDGGYADAAPAEPDYLMTYASGPRIRVSNSGIGSERVPFEEIDPRLFAGVWHIQLIPEWDSTADVVHTALHLGNNNIVFWSGGRTPVFTFKNGGVFSRFPRVRFDANTPVTLIVDMERARIEIRTEERSAGVDAAIDWGTGFDMRNDATVGVRPNGEEAFGGEIGQPIAGRPD